MKTTNVCRVFNMKKLGKEVTEVALPGNVHSVNFDNYGSYLLAGAGSTLSILSARKLGDEPIYRNEHAHDTGVVNVAKFSPNGRMIVSGGTEDRFMKVYGL
jgi:WD40 repeat protein